MSDLPLHRRAGLVLAGIFLLVLPSAYFPGFHDAFSSGKLLAILGAGIPAYLFLVLSRLREGDPLAGFRKTFAFGIPLLLAISALLGQGAPVHLVPFLLIAIVPLIFLEVGAAFGKSGGGRERLLLLLAMAAVPVLLFGSLRRLTDRFDVLEDREGGLASTLGNSNELGEYAAPLLVALLAAAAGASRRIKIAFVLLALPPLVLVVWSDCRGAWVASAAGLGVAFATALMTPGVPRPSRRTLGVVFISVVAAVVLVLFLPVAATVRERLATIVDPSHPTNVVRLGLWKGTLALCADAPFLGVGVGRFEVAFPPFRKTAEWLVSGYNSTGDSPHQEVLWILAEGGLPGILLAVVAAFLLFRQLRNSLKSVDPNDRRFGITTSGVLVAFFVLCMIRSPLHHPCGSLVVATLVGSLAAGATGRPFLRPSFWTTHVLILGSVVFFGMRDLAEDHQLFTARWSLVAANDAIRAGNASAAKEQFRAASTALRDLSRPFLGVPGPWTPARAYRAALVAGEIAKVHAVLDFQEKGDTDAWLVDDDVVSRLVDRALHLAPFHREALQFQAEAALQHVELLQVRGKAARATEVLDRAAIRLSDAILKLANAPGLRVTLARLSTLRRHSSEGVALIHDEIGLYDEPPRELKVLLGQLALRRGTEPASFGTYLDAIREAGGGVDLSNGLEAFNARRLTDAYALLLSHLSEHPCDEEALLTLGKIGFDTSLRSDEARDVANRAVARSRLLIALDADRAGREDETRLNVRLALSKDDELLDAWLLKARLAAREGDVKQTLESLANIRRGKVTAQDLRYRLERDAAFQDLLKTGALDPALADS